MRRLGYLLAALVIAVAWYWSDALVPPETVRSSAAVIRDGDTLDIAGRTFRLHGIDAPEYRQTCTDAGGRDWPCGKAARLQLAAFAASGDLVCEVRAKDQYAREVARCSSATVPDLGAALVSAGLAVSPSERGSAPYAEEEEAARSAKRGIWQGSFEPPDEWRASHQRASA